MQGEALQSVIESILFASDKPVPVTKFKDVLEEDSPKKEIILDAINEIREKYEKDQTAGVELREAQGARARVL